MMVNTMDMSAPVTRGELREELARAFEERLEPLVTKEYLEKRFEARLEPLVTKEYLEVRLEPLVTKEYLEVRLEPLVTKEYLEERLAPLATKEDLKAMQTELSKELAQHVKSMEENLGKQVSTFDDKYNDLPGRVNRLEGAVFPEGQPEDKAADHKARSEENKSKARPGEKKARSSTPARSPKRR